MCGSVSHSFPLFSFSARQWRVGFSVVSSSALDWWVNLILLGGSVNMLMWSWIQYTFSNSTFSVRELFSWLSFVSLMCFIS